MFWFVNPFSQSTVLYKLKFLQWFYFREISGCGLAKISTLFSAHLYVYKHCQKHENNNTLKCPTGPKS